jgi:hypothetical protein
VLQLYGVDPAEVAMKGRVSIRSAYFNRNEITRRIRDLLRERETVSADDVSVRAMHDKGLDPDNDRKLRADFTLRILVSFHDLMKTGEVERIDRAILRRPRRSHLRHATASIVIPFARMSPGEMNRRLSMAGT